MAQKFTNNATTRLVGSLTAVATSFTVTPGEGALFPAVTELDADYFLVTLEDSSGNKEIVKIIARTIDTFYIGSGVAEGVAGRAQEGTSALAFAATDLIELRLTSGFIDALKKGSVVYVIDGGGAVITAGIKGFIEVPFSGSLDAIRLFSDDPLGTEVGGDISIDILRDNYSGFPPDDTWNKMGTVTLVGSMKSSDDLSVGWPVANKQFTAGDIFAFDVNAPGSTTITRVTISMSVSRNA